MSVAAPPPEVAQVLDRYPSLLRRRLLELRRLILTTAAATGGVGPIEEALRWGQPAFLTSKSKSGSTIRMGPVRDSPDQFALFFHCQTTLVETFRHWFPEGLRFEGNRAIVFDLHEEIPAEDVRECVAAALTYHRRRSAH